MINSTARRFRNSASVHRQRNHNKGMFLIVSLHMIMVLQCKYEHLLVLMVQPRSSSRKLCSAWEEMEKGGKGGSVMEE